MCMCMQARWVFADLELRMERFPFENKYMQSKLLERSEGAHHTTYVFHCHIPISAPFVSDRDLLLKSTVYDLPEAGMLVSVSKSIPKHRKCWSQKKDVVRMQTKWAMFACLRVGSGFVLYEAGLNDFGGSIPASWLRSMQTGVPPKMHQATPVTTLDHTLPTAPCSHEI